MNKSYRVIWNKSTQTWQAVAEFAKSHGKSASGAVKFSVVSGAYNAVRFVYTVLMSGVLIAIGHTASAADEVYFHVNPSTNAATASTGAQSATVKIDAATATTPTGSSAGKTTNIISTTTEAVASNKDVITAVGGAVGGESLAIGIDVLATGKASVAIGKNVQANNQGAIAIGEGARALTADTTNQTKAIAIGGQAHATHDKTVAVGDQARALGDHAFAMGSQALAEKQFSTAVGSNANATGEFATALGKSAIASGNFGSAVGVDSKAQGVNSTAVGRFANANGSAGLALGYGATAGVTSTVPDDARNNAIAIGTSANSVGGHASIAMGNSSKATQNNAIAVGTNSNALAASSIAIGQNANINSTGIDKSDHSVALGTGASVGAGFQRSVALGAYSTVSAAVATNTATVGGITYSGFAGNNPAVGDVVSVGEASATGRKRQIQNVAAGRINATSTDAINGSQLYLTQVALDNVAQTTATNFGGGVTVGADGKLTAPTYNLTNASGQPITGVNATSNNVGGALTNLNNYVNRGFDVTDNDGAVKGTVTPGEKVQFANGNATTSVVTAEANNITKVQYNVEVDGTTIKVENGKLTATAQAPETTSLTTTGNKVANPASADENKVTTAKSVADAINASGFTLKTSANGGTKDATSTAEEVINPGDTVDMAAGKNLTVKQEANGKVTYATADDVKFDSVTFGDNGPKINNVGGNINVGDQTGAAVKITNVADGDISATSKDAVNGSQLYTQVAASKEKVESTDKTVKVTEKVDSTTGAKTFDVAVNTGKSLKVDPASGVIDVNTDDVTITKDPTTGAIKANTTGLTNNTNGTVNTPANTNALATAGDIANAINNSGFNLQANGDTASLVKTGNTVQFLDGNNIEITRAGNDITVATKKDVKFDSVTFGDNGPKINNVGGNINVGDQTGAAVKITNVADGDISATSKDAVNGSQLYTQVAASKEKVESTDKTVKVTEKVDSTTGAKTFDVAVNTGKSLKVDPASGVIDVNTDDVTITKDPTTGAIKANTTGLTNNTNGTVNTPANTNALATAGDIANAINNSGFNLQANGDTASLVKTGNTVQFLDGNNIEITRAGNDITVATKKDVKFDSVTFGDNGPKINNVGGNINVGDQTGAAVKITNVADGDISATSKDAVNGSQLYTQVAASKEKVESTDKTVKVTEKVDSTTGAKTFDVAVNTGKSLKVDPASGVIDVNTDDVTITKDPTTGAIKANTTGLTNNTNGTVNTPANTNALATAGDIANAINNSGFNLQANGDTASLVKTGNTVQFLDGNNIEITRAGNDITVATKKDVKFDSVTFGDNGPKINNVGGNINVGDQTGAAVKITNVADGDISATSKDAVNGSQLYTQVAASKEKVESTDKTVKVTEKVDSTTGAKTFDVAVNTGKSLKVDPASGVIDVNTDDVTITKDPTTGAIKANTTGLTNNTNGTVNTPANTNALATAGDIANAINNSGFNLQANGDTASLVKTGNTVQFLDGNNIEITRAGNDITVATKKDVKFDSVTFGDNGPKINNVGGNINVGDQTGAAVKITNVADGDISATSKDAVNGSQLYTQVAASKEKVESTDKTVKVTEKVDSTTGAKTFDVAVNTGKSLKVDPASGVIDVNTDDVTITKDPTTGAIKANTTGLTNNTNGTVNTPANTNALATAGDIANAINNSGFNLQANGDTASLVKTGNTVQFLDGNNIEITRAGNDITVATKKDVKFDSVTFGDNGPKINNVGGNINVGDQTGAAVKITNVADGDISATSKDAVNGSQLYTQVAASKEKVESTDKTVKVTEKVDSTTGAKTFDVAVNTGKSLKVDPASGVIDVNTDDVTITKDPTTGAIKANTTGLTNNTNGTVNTPANTNALATAGDIANAINNSGFNLQANGDTASLVKTGNTVQFLDGNNIEITRAGNDITVATKKDVKFDSVTFGDNGPKINNVGGNINVGDQTGAAVKITNVADGDISATSKDAVNGSQLYTQVAASKEKVESTDKTVKVTEKVDSTTGAKTFDVAVNTGKSLKVDPASGVIDVNTDDVTITKDPTTGAIKANTTGLTNNTNGTVNTPANTNALATAGDIANAINNSGFNLQANGDTASLVKTGNTVQFLDGNNIEITRAGNDITVATKKDVKFDSVTFGDNGPKINNVGGNINVGDQTGAAVKITNVADGDISATSKDAVNGSQLYTQVAASKEKVESTDKTVKVTEKVDSTTGAKTFDVAVNTGKSLKVDPASGVIDVNTDDVTITKDPTTGAIKANTTGLTNNTNGTVNTPANTNALATAGDIANAINNSGFNLQANGDTASLVKTGNTVQFLDGNNIEITRAGNDITVATKKDVKFDSVTFGDNGPKINNVGGNINVGDQTGAAVKITNVADGDISATSKDAVNGSQLYTQVAASKEKVESTDKTVKVTEKVDSTTGAKTFDVAVNTGKSLKVDPASGVIDVNTDDVTITKDPTTGAIKANTTGLTNNTNGTVNTPANTNALATAGDIANAINNSGFNLQANGDTASLVKTGNTVQFLDGNNIEITRAGNDITVATKKDVKFDSVTFGDNGPKINNVGGNINVGDQTGAAVKITNVADGDISATSKDAVNGSQLYTQVAASKEKVESTDKTVKVTEKVDSTTGAKTFDVAVNTGKSLKVDPASGVIDVNTDDVTITKDPTTGAIKANTTGLTNNTNGTVNTPANTNALATAGDIANAINNSGFNLQANGDTASLVKTGNTVQFLDGNNIEITRAGNDITVATKKDVKFDSVTFGDNGPKINNVGGNINVGDQTGAAVKITNVADGDISATSKDAVNGSQLYTQVAASKEKVESTDKTVKVTEKVDSTTGAKTFDVAVNTGKSLKVDPASGVIDVNTDDVTITKDPTTGAIKANTGKITSTDGKASPATGDANKVATVQNVADAINSSGFKLTTSASAGTVTGTTSELINPAETITVDAGKNIAVTQKGNTISVATKDDVSFNSVTSNTVAVNKGGNLTVGAGSTVDMGGNQITNVKSGLNGKTLDDIKADANAPERSNAATIGDLAQVQNNVTNITNITNNILGSDNVDDSKPTNVTKGDVLGKGPNASTALIDTKDVLKDKDGKPILTTYNVAGQTEYIQNDVIQAINHMNEQGIKFFHVNDGVTKPEDQAKNSIDSSASGAYATSVGYQTVASGEGAVALGNTKDVGTADAQRTQATGKNAIAIGTGSQANAENTIAIGTGNIVTGKNSGAIGDPSIINADGSYSVGNDNTVSTGANNTFILGNNVKATVGDSVYLGDKSSSSGVHTTANGGHYTYAGANDANVAGVENSTTAPNTAPVGVVSVGTEKGQTRQIQNVAAGVVSADSTDAINGSQLYDTHQAINNLAGNTINMGNQLNNRIDDVEDDANAGVSSAMAMAALPQAYLPGKSMLTGGMATYNGEGAVAVGLSKLSDNGRWVLKISGSADTRGNAGAAVGAGFHF